MTRILKITLLTAVLGAAALPVHGYFQSHSFFNPEIKYREWFHVTRWPGEAGAPRRTYTGLAAKSDAVSSVQPYTFSDEKFVMTEALWKKSKKNVEGGVSDWFDAEVVRQRADIDEHPPAMDFLAWMYEHGQGIKQDQRKAYMWYERAKLAGEKELRGVSEQIFERLPPPDQTLAQVQLADDVKRLNPESETTPQDFKQINLRVFRQRRGEDFYREQQERLERQKPKAIHR
jgi:TPR repeat protein